jgi:hypothetical protein
MTVIMDQHVISHCYFTSRNTNCGMLITGTEISITVMSNDVPFVLVTACLMSSKCRYQTQTLVAFLNIC